VRCEVVAVGTELLLGQVVDTNSAWIGEQLAAAGIDCYYQVKVGDNQGRVVSAIHAALARSDAVICCGGLGPTQDDITREAIAEVLGAPLELDEEVAARIEHFFGARGRPMSLNNMRQAEVPTGATVIPQVRGTAPGLICRLGDRSIYAVPGVPHEMREMVARAVIPDLVARSGTVATIHSRTLRTWGLAESALAEILEGRIAELDKQAAAGRPAPTIAFLASGVEGIKVRVTAKAPTLAEAEELVSAEEAVIRDLLGPVVFGVDAATMESAVGDLLLAAGRSLGVAESLTGGLVGTRLTAVPGASRWLRGSLVVYASDVKRSLLGVGPGPVVSEQAAIEMAEGVADRLGADVGLSLTGVAGPDEQDGQPVGTVWVGLAGVGPPSSRLLRLGSYGGGDREQIRQIATISALDMLRRRLMGE
jgi:competence/damage-inducible protein CinA-like protein